MARHKGLDWSLPEYSQRPGHHSWESIHTALLMDLRDELKLLKSLLHSNNVTRGIKRRVAAAARKRVAKVRDAMEKGQREREER